MTLLTHDWDSSVLSTSALFNWLANFWTQPLETMMVASWLAAVAEEEATKKRLAATEGRRGSGEPLGEIRKPWEAISLHSVDPQAMLPAALGC